MANKNEGVVVFLKKGYSGLENWLIAVAFSIIGSVAALSIDTLMIWKEHHN